MVYLDDIMTYNPTREEPKDHLQKFFQKLKENQLDVKRGKCCFEQGQINLLGHVVEFDRIGMGKRKIAAIRDWAILK